MGARFNIVNKPEWRIQEALEVADSYAGIDGGHHKMWVIDQIIRILTGDDYEEWVRVHTQGPDGAAGYYEWDEGIAP